MIALSSLTKSVLILPSAPWYGDVYLGVDNDLVKLLADTLENNGVVVKNSIHGKSSFCENIFQRENLLSPTDKDDHTVLRAIILMVR